MVVDVRDRLQELGYRWQWKVRMRQLAKRGYIVMLRREIGPRDGEVWYRAEAFVVREGVYRSGRRVVAQSPWTSEPDEALVALQGELGIGEEELWHA